MSNTSKVFGFLIKHGIGAPGPMAETQAKVYMRLRRPHPSATEKEILRTMFVQRAKIALATGSKELFYQMAADSDWVESVVKSNPDLLSMTIYIILCEHPELRSQDPRLAAALLSAGLTQDDIFREVITTVTDVQDKHAPIWRERYAGGLGPGRPSDAPKPDDNVRPGEATKPASVLRFEDHKKRVNSVLFFPDGRRLLSCGLDGTVKLWETSGRLIVALDAGGTVESIALSPDGSLAASSRSTAVDLWELGDARKAASFRGHEFEVYTVAFHPGGQHVVPSDEETVRVWDIGTGREVHRVTCGSDLFSTVAFLRTIVFSSLVVTVALCVAWILGPARNGVRCLATSQR